jgi:hypothetical protein
MDTNLVTSAATAYKAVSGFPWTQIGTGWNATSTPNSSPGMAFVRTATIGDRLTTTFRGTTVKVIYFPNGGANATWRWRIDGGTWNDVVDALSARVAYITQSGLSAGTHTIDVECNGDGVKFFYFGGIIAENATGLSLQKMCRYGALSSTASGGAPVASQNLGGRNNPVDLAIVSLGPNDANTNVVADTYIQNIALLLNEIRGGGTLTGSTDLMLVAPHIGSFDTAATPKYAEYVQRLEGLAKSYNAAFVNFWAEGRNSYNAWSALNYWGNSTSIGNAGADAVHLTDTAAQHMADVILPLLTQIA